MYQIESKLKLIEVVESHRPETSQSQQFPSFILPLSIRGFKRQGHLSKSKAAAKGWQFGSAPTFTACCEPHQNDVIMPASFTILEN